MNSYLNMKRKRSRVSIIFQCVLILFVIGCYIYMLSINPSSNEIWNDGFCARCDERYVVVKVTGDINLYACPKCNQEVKRLVWF